MKKADMTLDFKNDDAIVFGQSVKLVTTKSGHYTIPIWPYKTALNNLPAGISTNITLITIQTNKSKYEIALKLHRQFDHLLPERIIKLLNSAGDLWKDDDELKSLIKKVSDECQICQVYRKTSPRPVVGLPMATTFQECVAMDLKFYNGNILLYLVNHTTRLSSSKIIKSKEPKEIIDYIWRFGYKFMEHQKSF